MKKAKLLGAIALMFALALGAASCAQDSTPSGSKPSGAEPSGSESSGSDINGATDNNNTNSGGTQNSTPSGSKPSVSKPSVTKPEGTDIKDVIDNPDVDLSGTWKLTDAYCCSHVDGYDDSKWTTPEAVRDNTGILYDWNLNDDFCGEFSNDFLQSQAATFEEPDDTFIDGCLKVNDAKDEIYYYVYQITHYGLGTVELSLTFTKQQ